MNFNKCFYVSLAGIAMITWSLSSDLLVSVVISVGIGLTLCLGGVFWAVNMVAKKVSPDSKKEDS